MDFKEFQKAISHRDFPIEFPGHWVNSNWLFDAQSKKLKASLSPNNGHELVTPFSDKEALFAAIDAADEFKQQSCNLDISSRIDFIVAMRQALADFEQVLIDCVRIEAGKPLWEAQADLRFALSYLDMFYEYGETLEKAALTPAQMPALKGQFSLQPIGTTVAFLPFSTPVTSFAKYFSAAIFCGCPLILCPSSHAVLTGLFYGFLAEKLDFPKGAFQVVFGNFDTFKKSLNDRRIQAIIYTGSREHCDLIRRESSLIKGRQLILQSGGKNATLVHSSADIEQAVRCVLYGGLKSAGQLCTATSRIFCHHSLINNFSEALLDKIETLAIGETDTPDSGEVFLGPLYSKKAVEKFLRYQTMAHREAKKDLQWGKQLEGFEHGSIVRAGVHLMDRFDPKSAYQSNVLFCPDLALYEYDVLNTAIDMINATDAPFVVSAIGDAEILESRRQQFIAPYLMLNQPTVEAEYAPAIAGKFQSGHHRFNGAGLIALLSYPQLLRYENEASHLLESYPL